MLDELRVAAEEAVRQAKAAGAQDSWAMSARSRSTEFRYRKGQLEKAQESTSRSLVVRLYLDGRYSSHTTTDLRPERVKAFISEAVAMTRALEPDPHRKITPPELFAQLPQDDLKLVDPALAGVSADQRVEALTAMVGAAEAHDRVISVEGTFYDEHTHAASVSSNGFRGQREDTSVWLGAQVTVQDAGDRRPQEGMFMGGRQLAALPGAAHIGEEARRVATARLGSVKGPTARTIMVVEPRAAARLANYLLRANRARDISQGQSFFADLKGQQAFSKALTVVDDPLIPAGLASRQFDGEGIAARRLPIITEGRVDTFYVDTYYGSKIGAPPTSGSPSNQIIVPGARPLASIIGDLDDAILVSGWLGGNSDATSGDFSMGCQGHLVKDGKIGAPVNEMNVTGNLLTLFAALIEVGSDPWPYGSLQAPTLVFEGVQFSGV